MPQGGGTGQGFFEREQFEAVRRLLPDDLKAVVTIAYTYGWPVPSEVLTLERAAVPRSVAMKITGHRTEAVYRRYAIVSDADLREASSG